MTDPVRYAAADKGASAWRSRMTLSAADEVGLSMQYMDEAASAVAQLWASRVLTIVAHTISIHLYKLGNRASVRCSETGYAHFG